jgi:hypothetical protein
MKNIVLYRSKCKWQTLVIKLNTNVCDQKVFFFESFITSALISSLLINIKIFYGCYFCKGIMDSYGSNFYELFSYMDCNVAWKPFISGINVK